MAENKVVCPLCGSEVSRESFKLHFDTEKYVLNRISQEHPDWKESDGSCKKCLQYYMTLGEK
ncbi:MAG: hypothetical protein C4532_01960 [Candidatus Abyssobacteria bacterium SURF_17]|jgi:hypothetical protein|uniref:Uncharacterized protein n=1 Tax=Candidatus Abyssobacteria bacterium SURF_17 TaxID=2093361 RepID=A0A419F852_9BACT|nr:MAG: hypothetical protein C4532_01960 [Candidatus Abyssubacteria bacterium SURF_17]